MLGWLKSLFKSNSTILVSIPVADTFPNPDELAARNDITDELDAMGIGEFVVAGGGFNQMDFEYQVAAVETAKSQIATVMKQRLPGKDYEVTVE